MLQVETIRWIRAILRVSLGLIFLYHDGSPLWNLTLGNKAVVKQNHKITIEKGVCGFPRYKIIELHLYKIRTLLVETNNIILFVCSG